MQLMNEYLLLVTDFFLFKRISISMTNEQEKKIADILVLIWHILRSVKCEEFVECVRAFEDKVICDFAKFIIITKFWDFKF